MILDFGVRFSIYRCNIQHGIRSAVLLSNNSLQKVDLSGVQGWRWEYLQPNRIVY